MNELTKKQFLSLLRSGIWCDQTPDKALFTQSVDWNMIFQVSKEQTVCALVWDGLLKLDESLMPERSIKLMWYNYVLNIERTAKMLNAKVVEIFDMYKVAGVSPILLKGQGMATLYPNPLHRTSGDIDVYVGRGGYDMSNKILLEAGATNMSESGDHHSHLIYNGVCVENHYLASVLFTKKQTQQLNNLLNGWYPLGADMVLIDGVEIPVPPMNFNSIFIFDHLSRHFISFGVGLRQVCDWMMVLNRRSEENINPIAYKNIWRALSVMCVDYLGLAKERAPFYSEHTKIKASKLLDRILKEGNFGYNDTTIFTQRPKGYLQGKLFSLKRQLQRWWALFKLFPIEIFRYLLFYKPKVSFKQLLSDINDKYV